MRFSVGAQLEYAVTAPSTLIFNLQALGGLGQTIVHESLHVEGAGEVEAFEGDGGRARFFRLHLKQPGALRVDYEGVVESRTATVRVDSLGVTPIARKPPEVLPYLFPSRYCESDRLGRLAWQTFGKLKTPHEQVNTICAWIHDNVTYLRGSTQASTSAAETLVERAGVCRDFAHLGIALCRALNLPARYATGYACGLNPPDLHAWFEVALGGRWIVFDATRLAPLNGLGAGGLWTGCGGRGAGDAIR
jgi:transglutaminase-like putative cysteine protease